MSVDKDDGNGGEVTAGDEIERLKDELRRIDKNTVGLYQGRIPDLERRVTALEARMESIEQAIAKPAETPPDENDTERGDG